MASWRGERVVEGGGREVFMKVRREKTRDELAGGRGVEEGRKALTVGEAGATGR